MKIYKSGIFMGFTSIASSVFLLGIPSGTAPLEVANGALFAAGIISVLMMGPVMKKYRAYVLVDLHRTQHERIFHLHAGICSGSSDCAFRHHHIPAEQR